MAAKQSGGSGGDKTQISGESGGARPRGVRPPARNKPGMASKTMKSDGGGGGSAPSRFSAATRVFGDESSSNQATQKVGGAFDGKTRTARGSISGGETVLASSLSSDPVSDAISENAAPKSARAVSDDPVHGWFVVVDGPGKGNSIHIGGGRSSIGRDKSQHITVDFGDEAISREKHSWVTFDGRDGKFYLSAGDGRNLCYINDEPVLTSLSLKDRDTILIGETTLVFIAFCGDQFSW